MHVVLFVSAWKWIEESDISRPVSNGKHILRYPQSAPQPFMSSGRWRAPAIANAMVVAGLVSLIPISSGFLHLLIIRRIWKTTLRAHTYIPSSKRDLLLRHSRVRTLKVLKWFYSHLFFTFGEVRFDNPRFHSQVYQWSLAPGMKHGIKIVPHISYQSLPQRTSYTWRRLADAWWPALSGLALLLVLSK